MTTQREHTGVGERRVTLVDGDTLTILILPPVQSYYSPAGTKVIEGFRYVDRFCKLIMCMHHFTMLFVLSIIASQIFGPATYLISKNT